MQHNFNCMQKIRAKHGKFDFVFKNTKHKSGYGLYIQKRFHTEFGWFSTEMPVMLISEKRKIICKTNFCSVALTNTVLTNILNATAIVVYLFLINKYRILPTQRYIWIYEAGMSISKRPYLLWRANPKVFHFVQIE